MGVFDIIALNEKQNVNCLQDFKSFLKNFKVRYFLLKWVELSDASLSFKNPSIKCFQKHLSC